MTVAQMLQCEEKDLVKLASLSPALLEWFRANARMLPWRENPAPYRVWVSEVMLQQTRVEAVKVYFSRFMAALPTLEALAAVEEDALLKLWEGLGYYSRARNLRRAAQQVVQQFDGALPGSYEQLLLLPGVGEYTAGAIASIAFGVPVPAVDGNVHRVLTRILASAADVAKPPVRADLRSAAATMLTGESPGDLNQAIMELGATVCVPNAAPRCALCPVWEACEALKQGRALEFPVKTGKKPRRVEERTILLTTSPDGALLFQRGAGLLAGMWEPLNLEGALDEEQAAAALRQLGGEPASILPLADQQHIFTHVQWRMRGFLVRAQPFQTPGGLWATKEELLEKYALPSAFRGFFREAYREFFP